MGITPDKLMILYKAADSIRGGLTRGRGEKKKQTKF
jgi:hypothetical protein